MKKIVFILSLVLVSWVFTSAQASDEFLTADQLKALLSDKTFDSIYLQMNKRFSVYEAPDGSHYTKRSNRKTEKAKWWVTDDGEHCITNKKWKNHPKWRDGRCSKVKAVGDGEYHKISKKGQHTHTWSNFREGNQL